MRWETDRDWFGLGQSSVGAARSRVGLPAGQPYQRYLPDADWFGLYTSAPAPAAPTEPPPPSEPQGLAERLRARTMQRIAEGQLTSAPGLGGAVIRRERERLGLARPPAAPTEPISLASRFGRRFVQTLTLSPQPFQPIPDPRTLPEQLVEIGAQVAGLLPAVYGSGLTVGRAAVTTTAGLGRLALRQVTRYAPQMARALQASRAAATAGRVALGAAAGAGTGFGIGVGKEVSRALQEPGPVDLRAAAQRVGRETAYYTGYEAVYPVVRPGVQAVLGALGRRLPPQMQVVLQALQQRAPIVPEAGRGALAGTVAGATVGAGVEAYRAATEPGYDWERFRRGVGREAFEEMSEELAEAIALGIVRAIAPRGMQPFGLRQPAAAAQSAAGTPAAGAPSPAPVGPSPGPVAPAEETGATVREEGQRLADWLLRTGDNDLDEAIAVARQWLQQFTRGGLPQPGSRAARVLEPTRIALEILEARKAGQAPAVGVPPAEPPRDLAPPTPQAPAPPSVAAPAPPAPAPEAGAPPEHIAAVVDALRRATSAPGRVAEVELIDGTRHALSMSPLVSWDMNRNPVVFLAGGDTVHMALVRRVMDADGTVLFEAPSTPTIAPPPAQVQVPAEGEPPPTELAPPASREPEQTAEDRILAEISSQMQSAWGSDKAFPRRDSLEWRELIERTRTNLEAVVRGERQPHYPGQTDPAAVLVAFNRRYPPTPQGPVPPSATAPPSPAPAPEAAEAQPAPEPRAAQQTREAIRATIDRIVERVGVRPGHEILVHIRMPELPHLDLHLAGDVAAAVEVARQIHAETGRPTKARSAYTSKPVYAQFPEPTRPAAAEAAPPAPPPPTAAPSPAPATAPTVPPAEMAPPAGPAMASAPSPAPAFEAVGAGPRAQWEVVRTLGPQVMRQYQAQLTARDPIVVDLRGTPLAEEVRQREAALKAVDAKRQALEQKRPRTWEGREAQRKRREALLAEATQLDAGLREAYARLVAALYEHVAADPRLPAEDREFFAALARAWAQERRAMAPDYSRAPDRDHDLAARLVRDVGQARGLPAPLIEAFADRLSWEAASPPRNLHREPARVLDIESRMHHALSPGGTERVLADIAHQAARRLADAEQLPIDPHAIFRWLDRPRPPGAWTVESELQAATDPEPLLAQLRQAEARLDPERPDTRRQEEILAGLDQRLAVREHLLGEPVGSLRTALQAYAQALRVWREAVTQRQDEEAALRRRQLLLAEPYAGPGPRRPSPYGALERAQLGEAGRLAEWRGRWYASDGRIVVPVTATERAALERAGVQSNEAVGEPVRQLLDASTEPHGDPITAPIAKADLGAGPAVIFGERGRLVGLREAYWDAAQKQGWRLHLLPAGPERWPQRFAAYDAQGTLRAIFAPQRVDEDAIVLPGEPVPTPTTVVPPQPQLAAFLATAPTAPEVPVAPPPEAAAAPAPSPEARPSVLPPGETPSVPTPEAKPARMEPEVGPPEPAAGAPAYPDRPVGEEGPRPLEDLSAPDVPRAGEGRPSGAGAARGGRTDEGRPSRPGSEGRPAEPGLGTGPGGVAVPAERGGPAEPRPEPAGVGAAGAPRVGSPELGGSNYVIKDPARIGEGGPKTKFRANVEAIRLLKQIEAENRPATPEEQAVLVKYVGWGGLSQAFDPWNKEWAAEFAELKTLLTPEEYDSARASTPNAHYTAPDVIQAMYAMLERLGFTGGRVLEPAVGIGHFFGLMPREMAARSKLTGIELDSITGRIAKLLYPKADIRVQGFEAAALPDNFFDVAISNVPFGDYPVVDARYRKAGMTRAIHNYFFAKALDKVRPGGLLAFITSHYTMDSVDTRHRQYIAERADLVAAIRLPNTAFRDIAGTAVTTDILILQKREPGTPPKGEAWIETVKVELPHPRGGTVALPVNEYFIRHRAMMLGKPSAAGTMYAGGEFTLEPDGRDLRQALTEALGRLPEGIVSRVIHKPTEAPEVRQLVPAPGHVKDNAYAVIEGKLYRRAGAEMVPVEMPAATAARVRAMIGIRDAVRELFRLQLQDAPEAAITKSQERLGKLYDAFVKRFGYLHEPKNQRAFTQDPDYYLLMSLERWDPSTKTATKADIFTKRTIRRYKPVESVATAQEALVVSLNERGRVDLERMAQLTGKTPEELQADLRGVIFHDPEDAWRTADDYLSGNVRARLRAAEGAAQADPTYAINVEALRAVQPDPIKPSEIHVRLGTPWIPPSDLEAFLAHLLEEPYTGIRVRYVPALAEWIIDESGARRYRYADSVANTRKWGTDRYTALELVQAGLNGKDPKVYDAVEGPGGTERHVLNPVETEAAREKLRQIQDEFRRWLWSDPDRAERLATKYNEEFNNIRLRTYDGSHLTFPGMNPAITLAPYQRNAVWRAIQGGNALLAHAVGAGKTFEMAAAAMELKRLGILKKPMFVVPNHLVEQWAEEFQRLYPAATLLVTTQKDFTPKRRRLLMNRIATGDYDAVIVAESHFVRIPMSANAVQAFFQEQLRELEEAIVEEAAQGRRAVRGLVKRLEKQKRRLEAKMKQALEALGQDQDYVAFEELGVDGLFVDEAHRFKNLFYATKMARVAGLGGQEGNDKTFDLLMKVRYIQRLNGGRGIVFATGTPISNTMAEMFTLQRYLQPEVLKERGLAHFDAWASAFGEVVTALELAPEGTGYRPRQRFSKFVNLPELMQLFRTFADVQTREMLKLPTADVRGGRRKVVTVKPSPQLVQYVRALADRASAIRSGKVQPHEDNMLKVTSDGRKAALDMRLVDPTLPEYPDSKINALVRNLVEIWRATAQERKTQLVFLDLSTPRGAKEVRARRRAEAETEAAVPVDRETLVIYQEIREKLVRAGIPAAEIAFIHEAESETDKQALFDAMNEGRVRILIGSTEKMGVGMNVQRKLLALHHLDAPWRPTDIEQREGRILRQGNENPEVEIYTYVTEGSFDAYMWQTLVSKATFISQVMAQGTALREAQDVGEMVLSYAEVMALASGNPLVREKVEVDTQVRRYQALRKQFEDALYDMRLEIRRIPQAMDYLRQRIAVHKRTLKAVQPTRGDQFSITIRSKRVTQRKAAGALLHKLAETVAQASPEAPQRIGEFAGLDLLVSRFGTHLLLQGVSTEGEPPVTYETRRADTELGTVMALEHLADKGIRAALEADRDSVQALEKKLADLRQQVAMPFEHEETLRRLLARQAELTKLLDLDQPERQVMPDEEAVEAEEGPVPTVQAFRGPLPAAPAAGAGPARPTPVLRPMQRAALVRYLSQQFGVPIRQGRFRERAEGIYKIGPEVVRTKRPEDLPVIAHEVGHHLDKQFRLAGLGAADELMALGQQTAKKRATKAERRREGVAEFFRIFLSEGDAAAQQAAPQYYALFLQRLQGAPEVLEALRAAQELYRGYFRAPAAEKIRATIAFEPTTPAERPSLRGRFWNAYTAWVDDLAAVQQAQRRLTGGRPLPPDQDPYLLARLARGVPEAVEELVFGRTRRGAPGGRWAGPSLESILRPIMRDPETEERYWTYADARRIVELADRGFTTEQTKGISRAEAEAAIRELETPEFQEVQRQRVAFMADVLRHWAAAGFATEEQVETMLRLNREWLPWLREAREGPARGRGRAGGPMRLANIGPGVRRIRGGMGTIIHPLEGHLRQIHSLMDLAARNRAARALTDLAKDAEGFGWLIEGPLPPSRIPVTVTAEDVRDILAEVGARPEDVDPDVVATIFRGVNLPTVVDAQNRILRVYEDGRPRFYQIDPEQKLDADLYAALLSLDAESTNIMIRVLSPFARILRATVTLVPEFIYRNALRDMAQAAVYGRGVPGEALARGLFQVFTRGELYQRWRLAGGATSAQVSVDRDALREMRRRFRRAVPTPNEILRALSTKIEAATRVGEFAMAVQGRGGPAVSDALAAIESREITIDFQRAGTWGRAWNKIAAFFNPGMQDLDKFVRMHFNRRTGPRAALRGLLFLTLPTILLYLANRDDPLYEELPQWRKDLFWNLRVGDHFVPIPVPHVLGFVYKVLPERIMRFIDQEDPRAFAGLGTTAGALVVPNFIPTALALLAELGFNWSFFQDRPIVPEREKRLPAELQYGTYTTEVAKIAGRTFGVSPRKVEHAVRGLTGGVGQASMLLLDAILKGAGIVEPPPRPRLATGIERALRIEPVLGSGSASIDEFYRVLEDAERTYAGLRRRIEIATGTAVDMQKLTREQVEVGQRLVGNLSPEEQTLLQNLKKLRRVERILSQARRARRAIEERRDLSADRKQEALRKIDRTMTNIVRVFFGKRPIAASGE